MKITYEKLAYRCACSEGLEWFLKNFGEKAEVEHTQILAKLHGQRCEEGWGRWLLFMFALSGICEEWRDNGTFYAKAAYKEGKQHGTEVIYYPNGYLRLKCSWKNGVLHGMHEMWEDNGDLCSKRIFEDGELVARIV